MFELSKTWNELKFMNKRVKGYDDDDDAGQEGIDNEWNKCSVRFICR